MKINLIIVVASIFLLGCSAQKEKYILMSEVFKNTREPYGLKEIDILEHTSLIYPSFLETDYQEYKKIYIKKGIFPSEGTFHWNNKENAWLLTDSDVEFMTKKIKTQDKEFWQSKAFIASKDVKVNIIESPVLQNNKTFKDLEKEIYDRLNNGRQLYCFSAPIFNKRKDTAIISYNLVFLMGTGSILFYKKINNKWMCIGKYY